MTPHGAARCQPSDYDEIKACRANATKRIIVAAACHSKDTGGFTTQGGEMYLDVTNFRHWRLDVARMRLTVGAGVTYMDIAADLAGSRMALPAYGNYGGQTIVGAMSTSTHGAGVPSLSNFVTRMAVVDGSGRRRNITRADRDFPAWANSLGALGVVAEAEFILTPNWNVLETNHLNLRRNQVVTFLRSNPLSYAFYTPASRTVQRQRPTGTPCRGCFFAWRRTKTALAVNATYPKDNYTRGSTHVQVGGIASPRVYAFNDMVHWETKRPRQFACYDRVAKQAAWTGPIRHLRSELELMIRPDELDATMALLEPVRYGGTSKSLVVEFRYVLKDTQDVLLSPYRDGDRIAVSIPGVTRVNGVHVVQLLTQAKLDVRFHRGKGAPRELVEASTWDVAAAGAFRAAKQANDPAHRFGSRYLDLLPFCRPLYTAALAKSTWLPEGEQRPASTEPTTATPLKLLRVPTSAASILPMLAFGPQSHKPDFILKALSAGFRHLDTSYHYSEGASQRNIGAGVLSFGRREEVFVTTKINGCGCTGGSRRYHGIRRDTCFVDTLRAVHTSLKELRMSYVDLLLLHHPPACRQGGRAAGNAVDCSLERTCSLVKAQWGALEHVQQQGKVRYLGVSNYCPSCVKCLLRTAKVPPAVAQLMVSLGAVTPVATLTAWSERHAMRIMAYSPINGLGLSAEQRDHVARIGAEHGNRSFVQVALRWLIQHGITPIVSSRNINHLRENLEIFQWRLSNAAMSKLDMMRGSSSTNGPSQDCAWVEGEAPPSPGAPGRRLVSKRPRMLLTTSTSTSRRLATYDEYALAGLSVLDYIRTTSANVTAHNSQFTALEIGIGEGRAVLELQHQVPNSMLVGINKPMPDYQWRASIVQSAGDLRRSAALYGIPVSGPNFPKVFLSNATDKVLMTRASSSARLVVSQHVYHYFSEQEREALFVQIRRILDDELGLSYVAWPAAGTKCEHTFGALRLKEGQAVLLGCEHSKGSVMYAQCFYIKRMVGVNSQSAANGGCRSQMKKWACRTWRYHMIVSVQAKGATMVGHLDRAVEALAPIDNVAALQGMATCLIVLAG
jgi:diketogulonate reductase-like aldo/keto reductase